jgi:hypothetical protein
VLSLDFYGTGQSDLVCSDDGLAFYVDQVVDLVETLGFTKPFSLWCVLDFAGNRSLTLLSI